MIVRGKTFLQCDECEQQYLFPANWTDKEIRDVANNDGWQYTKNGIDWCEQCASVNKREGE